MASVENFTDALKEGLKVTDEIQDEYQKSGYADKFKSIKYTERVNDPNLEKMKVEEEERFRTMSERLYGKIDGEIDMDFQGNIKFKPF